MKSFIPIFLLLIISIFSGCSSKGYYFPIRTLDNGKVYKYECKKDPTKTEYWKLTSVKNEFLITEAFDAEFRQYELFKERVTPKGTELAEFISYWISEDGQKDTVINKPVELDVFQWNTAEAYQYSSESIDEDYGKITLLKKRAFLKKEKIVVLGKERTVLKFRGSYRTQIEKTKETYDKKQFSYYAKGLGLVKMEKEYSDGSKVILDLAEIISIDDWEKMKSSR